MRSQEEIVQRYKQRAHTDLFGWEVSEYVDFLDYEHAKEFLKPETTAENWEGARATGTPAELIAEYMPFAWEKANNCRGLSAYRSLMHMLAWLWLDGKDEFIAQHNNFEDYEYYGKPQLIAICEEYGLDWKQWDDGVRTNAEE